MDESQKLQNLKNASLSAKLITSALSKSLEMPTTKVAVIVSKSLGMCALGTATAYCDIKLARLKVFGNADDKYNLIEPYLVAFLQKNPGSKVYVNDSVL